MTQASYTQRRRTKVASQRTARVRTLAERRADFEAQMRECSAKDGIVALTELSQVSERIKQLRERTGLKQYEVASAINVPPRTYQSWENGEVETDRENYVKIGKELGASANWILFGQEDEPPFDVGPTPGVTGGSDMDEILRLLRELVGGQAELSGRLLTVERLLEDRRKQKQPASPKRKARSN